MKLPSLLAGGLLALAAPAATVAAPDEPAPPAITPVAYGTDVSFPMLNPALVPGPLGDRRALYDDFMAGCHAKFLHSPAVCDRAEQDRIAMAARQSASMQNYTDAGYQKVRAPAELYDILRTYWEKNQADLQDENWYGFTYVNHWAAPTYMLNVGETQLRGGRALKQRIWNLVKPVLEEWTGMELKPSCEYMGIRKYTTGAIFAPHADRQPLISSVILNVDQDVEEDWPLEVIGRDGLARNVTMEPGDMIMYESHSLIHGRPFPLKGKYYANIFIHFEPTGKLLRPRATPVVTDKGAEGMPIYILRDSPEAELWRKQHPKASMGRKLTRGATPKRAVMDAPPSGAPPLKARRN